MARCLFSVLVAFLTGERTASASDAADASSEPTQMEICLFLCGDVMTGRGIDQILPQSVTPELYEPWVRDARAYVRLAEEVSGPIPRNVAYDYIWGDAMEILNAFEPALRIINLETSVTTHNEAWMGKQIHYRMHPDNVEVLRAARIDIASLANNHVMDWGREGMIETLQTLESAGVKAVGAGLDRAAARQPLLIELDGEHSLAVVAVGTATSGVPAQWEATNETSGIFFAETPSLERVDEIRTSLENLPNTPSLVVASIHWGGNWDYTIPEEQQTLARALIDRAGVDIVHGHSSHHPKGIEVYRNRLIFYGCGDFVTDYEGITGHEALRGDLGLMYFPKLDATTGELLSLTMVPTTMRAFQVRSAEEQDVRWLAERLSRECAPLGTRIETTAQGYLQLTW